MLQREKEYVQNILDLQDNLIMVTDGEQVVNVNRAVFDFFAVNKLSEFQMQYTCVSHTFKEREGYFHLGLVNDKSFWIEDVIKRLESDDVVVAIEDKENQIHSFTIKVKSFYDLYILSLTDITSISQKTKKFEHEANFDTLTQIYNRNMFQQLMEEKLHNRNFSHAATSFVIMDIDYFKKVNDTYGHLVGDVVLKHLSSLVSKHTRESDIFARWGGEEFVLALDTNKQNAKKIIENLRAIIEQEPFEEVGKITCSFGITDVHDGDDLKSITKRADEALYDAKDRGRNRVCTN